MKPIQLGNFYRKHLVCPRCGAEFVQKVPVQKYCKVQCAEAARKEREATK